MVDTYVFCLICVPIFWKEMVTEIEKHFFDGGENGKTPKYSMTDMEKYNFK